MSVTGMRRREFITLLGSAAAWPLAARGQPGERARRIGLLMGTADDREGQARVTALKQGLQELGPHSPDNALSFGAVCAIQI
jgi:putative ABC transport system substrate-binding protein